MISQHLLTYFCLFWLPMVDAEQIPDPDEKMIIVIILARLCRWGKRNTYYNKLEFITTNIVLLSFTIGNHLNTEQN